MFIHNPKYKKTHCCASLRVTMGRKDFLNFENQFVFIEYPKNKSPDSNID